MKNLFLLLLLAFSSAINAQLVRPFVGASAYLHSDFSNSFFVGVDGGAEFTINHLIKPELEISYFYGPIDDDNSYSDQGQLISIFDRSASALNFNFCPKICLGNNGQNNTYLVIIPKYSFSKVEAKGDYTFQNNNGLKTTTKQTVTDWQHSLGIGIGIDIGISENNSDSICFNIYYQNVDMGKALNDLDHRGARIDTDNVLGAGFNYYFSFKKRTSETKSVIPKSL